MLYMLINLNKNVAQFWHRFSPGINKTSYTLLMNKEMYFTQKPQFRLRLTVVSTIDIGIETWQSMSVKYSLSKNGYVLSL